MACAWVLLQSLLERWHALRCFMLSSRSSTFRRFSTSPSFRFLFSSSPLLILVSTSTQRSLEGRARKRERRIVRRCLRMTWVVRTWRHMFFNCCCKHWQRLGQLRRVELSDLTVGPLEKRLLTRQGSQVRHLSARPRSNTRTEGTRTDVWCGRRCKLNVGQFPHLRRWT